MKRETKATRAALTVAEAALSEAAEHDLSDKTAYRVSEALARIAELRNATPSSDSHPPADSR